jgi:hypothetical protein|tara:strand:- start:279 stop:491 length:213 start_codon:yes stop_codon:yes gene_type:complete
MKRAIISEVRVELKEDGNLELVYRSIPADKFMEVMDLGLPGYENTKLLKSFMDRLENITREYLEDVRKLL